MDLSPLVISYENNFSGSKNAQNLKYTLENNGWEHVFIGEGKTWSGVEDKIDGYFNYLLELPTNKVVVLVDSRDVLCCRSPKSFLDKITPIINENKIIVSAELFLHGHIDWSEHKIKEVIEQNPRFFWQGIPLTRYMEFYGIDKTTYHRKYVNSGLIAGKACDLLEAFRWIRENNFVDDQLGLATYTNTFPEKVYLDYKAEILHTTSSFVNGGFYKMAIQRTDAPNMFELLGHSSYFLHVPGINVSAGQQTLYNYCLHILSKNKDGDKLLYNLYNLTEEECKRTSYDINIFYANDT